MKTQDTIIAYDRSGSTGGVELYHKLTQKIVSKYNDNNARILLWDDRYEFCDFQNLKYINVGLRGYGGTDIQNIASAIERENFNGNLIIITDGQVSSYGIDECDRLLFSRKFNNVEVHVIGYNANMSVSCPFTRNSPHQIHIYENTENSVDYSVSIDDLNTISIMDNISTVIDFDSKFDSLLKGFTARMMGRNLMETELHDGVVNMQKRVLADIAKNKSLNYQDKIETLKNTIKSKEFEKSIEIYKEISISYYCHSEKTVIDKFNQLLNITQGGLRNVFSHQLRRADYTQNITPQVTISDEIEVESDYTCPISFENESDIAIMIRDGVPILDNVDPKVMENLIKCPLSVLNYPDICKDIIKRFDNSVGVPSWLMMNKEYQKSPFTRAELIGSLYLGCNKSQTEATKYTIAQMLRSETKNIGNMNLWFMVVCLLLDEVERFDEIRTQIYRKMKYVMDNYQSYASLSGNAQYMMLKVPLGLSFWMIATAPLLELPSDKDMSRQHIWYMDIINKLAELGQYPIDSPKLTKHYNRLKALYKLLLWKKKSPEYVNNISNVLSKRCIKIDNNYIPIDGMIDDDTYINKILKKLDFSLSKEEIYNLINMVDANMSGNSINLPIDWIPKALPNTEINWVYGQDKNGNCENIDINIKTCRPYYIIKNKNWEEIVNDIYGKDANYISLNESYGRYIVKYEKYPTLSEFILFVWNYYSTRGFNTLPAPIVNLSEKTIAEYSDCRAKYTPKEFGRLFEINMDRKIRMKNEQI